MNEDAKIQVRAQATLDDLLQQRCLMLATVDGEGRPEASTLPFLLHGDEFVVLASELARHTHNLRQQGEAAVLITEDEAECRQPFARQRLQMRCRAQLVTETDQTEVLREGFMDRFGKTVELLTSLPDFRFFALHPVEAQLVTGFGQAWRLDWPARRLQRITPSGDD